VPPLAGIVLLCSLPIPIALGLYWHWKVYGLYRRLGIRAREIGYYWFSFELQNPNMARQLSGDESFASRLPAESMEQVALVRRQARYITAAMFLWIIMAIILFVVSGTH
jgi:hypothetical protein